MQYLFGSCSIKSIPSCNSHSEKTVSWIICICIWTLILKRTRNPAPFPGLKQIHTLLKVIMTRKYQNHRQQTNPCNCEEKSQNTNSHTTTVRTALKLSSQVSLPQQGKWHQKLHTKRWAQQHKSHTNIKSMATVGLKLFLLFKSWP